MAGIQQLTADQKEYLINGVATYVLWSDMKTELVDNQGIDGDWLDGLEASINLEAYRRRAFSDTYGFAGSDRQWAETAWAQLTPAPSGCAQSTFDTEGGEEIIILGSLFSPGCTATIGGEDIEIISMTPGTILGITPALAAAADNDIVVTSAADNAGTLTPGPASAKKTPAFTSITPNTGPAAGGSRHILVGTGFTPGVAVTIGGHACTVERISETHLIVKPPAHAAGALNIVITNTNSEADTEVGAFTYV